MRRFLPIVLLALVWAFPAKAQAPCIGVGGVSTVPQVGITCGQEPTVSTYVASAIGIVPAASATDIACLKGAANTVTRVQSIRVSGTAGTGIIVPAVINLHPTALDSGGTPATSTALLTVGKLDSSLSTAKSTSNSWTANPTINETGVVLIDSSNLVLAKTDGTNGLQGPATLFDWSAQRYSTVPILRSAVQELCVNLNATSPSSGLVNVTFKFTEASQ